MPGTKNNIYRYTNQRSSKICKTSASDHQEDQPRWPPCWNQELTQRDNKEVHMIPSANIEDPRHQASLSLLLPYAQPGKRQQISPQEHPLQQTNKHRHSKLANCVYNSLYRSLQSHQHKPEPTTVTRCSLPMTAATLGGRPPHQQEQLLKKRDTLHTEESARNALKSNNIPDIKPASPSSSPMPN